MTGEPNYEDMGFDELVGNEVLYRAFRTLYYPEVSATYLANRVLDLKTQGEIADTCGIKKLMRLTA